MPSRPIVAADSINREVAYAAARYGVGGADYLNCPLTREEYARFREALLTGERYPLHDFERATFFEGCLPIEELAERGEDTLRFGPMRPVGLRDPRTGKRPFAVVQLRQENQGPDGQPTMYNLVGFQTRLRRGDQVKALRLIPGLERAEILRYGSVHRNTFLTAPVLLEDTLQFRGDPRASSSPASSPGSRATWNPPPPACSPASTPCAWRRARPLLCPPRTTMLGGLLHYLTTASPATFQPINANFGLLPVLSQLVRDRQERNRLLAARPRPIFSRGTSECAERPARIVANGGSDTIQAVARLTPFRLIFRALRRRFRAVGRVAGPPSGGAAVFRFGCEGTVQAAIEAYLGHLKGERDASVHTLRNYRVDLTQFLAYLRERAADHVAPSPAAVDQLAIRGFVARLHGEKLARTSVARKLAALRSFFRYPLPSGRPGGEPGGAGARAAPADPDDAAPLRG